MWNCYENGTIYNVRREAFAAQGRLCRAAAVTRSSKTLMSDDDLKQSIDTDSGNDALKQSVCDHAVEIMLESCDSEEWLVEQCVLDHQGIYNPTLRKYNKDAFSNYYDDTKVLSKILSVTFAPNAKCKTNAADFNVCQLIQTKARNLLKLVGQEDPAFTCPVPEATIQKIKKECQSHRFRTCYDAEVVEFCRVNFNKEMEADFGDEFDDADDLP